MSIKEAAAAYEAARNEKERCDAALKEANKALDAASDKLAEAMLEEELASFKTEDATFSVVVKDYYRPDAARKPELYAALRENGLGGLVTETVNANTLSAAMREVAEDNGGELPPEYADLVKVYSKTTISRRKA